MKRAVILGALAALLSARALAAGFDAPLPPEKIPNVVTLPARYPVRWVFANSFSGVELIDAGATAPGHVRGQFGGEPFTNLQVSRTRPEIYLAETFYSRGVRGARTDVVTIFDPATLAPTGEILLSGSLRYLSGPQPNAFQLSGDESLGFIFGFTPASFVKVLDLKARKMISEVAIPGCALIYPTGPRGFSTLCGDGTMLSVTLDGSGRVASQVSSKRFNDLDNDPLFSQPARIGTVAYFPSFKGTVQPVDLGGQVARVLDPWPLVSSDEAKANWRPSGWQVAAGGPDGRLYVIMQPGAHDGTHKTGGPEVWVFDVAKRAKVGVIKLKAPAESIAVTEGDRPHLLAAGPDVDNPIIDTLQVYDLADDKLTNTLPLQPLAGSPVLFPARP